MYWEKNQIDQLLYIYLTGDPYSNAHQIYNRFGFSMDKAYQNLIDVETVRRENYKSIHRYSTDMPDNLAEDDINKEYQDLIE